jgi:hypothetical protein
LLFFVISAAYAFLILPVYGVVGPIDGIWRWLLWIFTVLVAPAGLGVFLAWLTQRRAIPRFMNRLGLDAVSPYRSGWDWKFARTAPTYLMVTLDDGSRVAGWFGERSLVGSDTDDRDVYVEQVWSVDQTGNWSMSVAGHSIWIKSTVIKYIEFYPSGEHNGQG